jgi:UDP-N-acetyl-D-mannosaminuronic acid dehydrogenase
VKFTKICVLGMGYIGLPTSSTFASRKIHVSGVDVNDKVIDSLQRGELHIIEDGLQPLMLEAINTGFLSFSRAVSAADAFIIAVPTPFKEDKLADMKFVVSAAESIIPHLSKGNLVVLESTSPPRTTVDLVAPILERSGFCQDKSYRN